MSQYRSVFAFVTAVAAAIVTASPAALAGPPGGFTGGVDVDFYNSYYFRGAYVFEDTFNTQPSVTLGWDFAGKATLSLNLWAAIPFTNRKPLRQVRDELDITLGVSIPAAKGLTVNAGAVVYLVGSADPFFHTEEVYAGLAYELPKGFTLGASVYGDVNLFKGVYFKVGPGWSTAIGPRVGFESGLFFGGTKYEGADFAAVEIGANAGFSVDAGAGVAVKLSGIYDYNASADDHLWAIRFGVGYAW